MAKLFISHAVHDKPLVEAFVDLLESGVGVQHKSIFCSSLKGQSIKPGNYFVQSIRENLDDATCVIALISPAYYASPFCLCELGGVWLRSKSLVPILVPPITHGELKAVLLGLQVSKIGADQHLDELRDRLGEELKIEVHSTPRWNNKRSTFLATLPGLLEKIKFSGSVPPDVHQKIVKELTEYKEENRKQELQVEKLEAIVTELKGLKDAKAVAKVVRRNSNEPEIFEQLVAEAKASLKGLASSVREALYYNIRDEQYTPDGLDEWDSVKTRIEYGELEEVGYGRAVALNTEKPRIRKAVESLDALLTWINMEATDAFVTWYDDEYDGEAPDPKLRSFWEEHFD